MNVKGDGNFNAAPAKPVPQNRGSRRAKTELHSPKHSGSENKIILQSAADCKPKGDAVNIRFPRHDLSNPFHYIDFFVTRQYPLTFYYGT